jgi:Protein of unknown function (DUF664)
LTSHPFRFGVSLPMGAAAADWQAQVRRVVDLGCDTCAGSLHMIEEYARHNGHPDLLRESIDGRTGYY